MAAADVYELVFAARCNVHHCNTSATERAYVWPRVFFITTLGKGTASYGPLLSARHPPPTARNMYAFTMYIILLSRQYTADRRVAAAAGSGLFPKWGRVRDFIDWSVGAQPFRVVSVSKFERSLWFYINDNNNIVVVKTRRLL